MSVSSLFRLPRRTPKPGRHTIAAVRSQRADAAVNDAADSARTPLPAAMPGPDTAPWLPAPEADAAGVAEAPGPLPLEPLPPQPGEDPAMTVALAPLREALREAAMARPATTEDLARAADRLRALPPSPGPDAPVAYLRNITPGPGRDPHEPLNGLPCFAGTTRMPDGSPVAGLFLGDEDAEGRLVLDVLSVAWLGRLIDAAEEAREELYALMSGRRDVADEAGAA